MFDLLFQLVSLGLLAVVMRRLDGVARSLASLELRLADAAVGGAGRAPLAGTSPSRAEGPAAASADPGPSPAPVSSPPPRSASAAPTPGFAATIPTAPASGERAPALPQSRARAEEAIVPGAPDLPRRWGWLLAGPAQPRPKPRPEPGADRPRIDFELRFGRRWAALLGGGIVAFGLALLVRHSIQQGYFPPSVRLAGAALLALALCAGAEAFRRRGTFAVPADAGSVRRMADIPSILLGTGLSGLFAVAYAAHAVYDFLGATMAFAVMAVAALAGIAASLVYGPALAVLGYLAALGVPFLIVGDGVVTGAAYVALVGVAGYAAVWRGGWRRLENPAGLVLLAWACLLRSEPLPALALVALPASAMAVAVTGLRLRPRVALASRHMSRQACLALALAGAHGFLLATDLAELPPLLVYRPVTTALGLAVLLAALALAATATRVRPMAPVLAAAIAGVLATLAWLAVRGGDVGTTVVGLAPLQVWLAVAAVSAAALTVTAVALRRASRTPLTTLVGSTSLAALLAAGDIILHAVGGFDRWLVAGLALAQGLGLLALARPRAGTIPAVRAFASVVVASVGLGLLGSALVTSGLADGPRITLVLALAAAGAAGLATLWRAPLFASVAGLAAVPVILHAGFDALSTLQAARHGEGTALWPILQNTLLPGLVLLGTVVLLHRRPGTAAVREADRRWLALLGAGRAAGGTGLPASLVVAATAAGGLLLAALVAVVRWIALGDAYAPLSAPSDIGLACTLALSGAVAALRLHRATGMPALARTADGLAKLAMPLLAGAILANPFLTHDPLGALPGLNLLVLAYLLPALLAWRLARDVAHSTVGVLDTRMRGYAGGMAVAGLLAYATGAVAQAFEGPVLALDRITEAELWTHTIVWLLLGVAVLGTGIRTGARVVRLTALGIVAAVAAKVALLDLAHLTGAARALSVIALGLVLLGIGMVYQRLAAREAGA